MHNIPTQVFRQLKVHKFMSIHLVEVSNVLSNIQAEKLNVNIDPPSEDKTKYYKSGETEDGIKVYWYRSLADFKYLTYSLVVAHEFFDALPIHKFQVYVINNRLYFFHLSIRLGIDNSFKIYVENR